MLEVPGQVADQTEIDQGRGIISALDECDRPELQRQSQRKPVEDVEIHPRTEIAADAHPSAVVANAAFGQDIEAEAREQANRDREAAVERATADIQRERDRAIADLRGEFADITVRAAERVIGQSLDRQAHQRIIDETLAESTFGGN